MKTLHQKEFGVTLKVFEDIDAPEASVYMGLSSSYIHAQNLLINNDKDQILVPWTDVSDIYEDYDDYGQKKIMIETSHLVIELIPA